jgi:hypothetical protein
LTQDSPVPRDLVILCHAKGLFAGGTVGKTLLGQLGRGDRGRFLAGERIALSPTATLRLESLRTLRESPAPGIALVLDASTALLNSLMYFDRVDVVIAIASNLARIEEWILRENASVPGTPISGALEGNHIAIEALWALTNMVDHWNAWRSPAQREAAIEILWSIYTRGCRPRFTDVKQWAQANGWSRSSSELLGQLSKDVAQNKVYPEEPGLYWWPDTFKVLGSLAWSRRNPWNRCQPIPRGLHEQSYMRSVRGKLVWKGTGRISWEKTS